MWIDSNFRTIVAEPRERNGLIRFPDYFEFRASSFEFLNSDNLRTLIIR
jgi:hypothetical protein